MCSIFGVIWDEKDNSVDENHFKSANNLLTHRGPDGSGIFKGCNYIFGHNILSIIGLGVQESVQPIVDNDHTLVFNGEIYNYKTLSVNLNNNGIFCSGKSDSEVLFKCLKYYGIEKTLSLIDGMFAFAFYDKNNGFFIARDRIGEKPLYWYKDNNCFWFGSEIKAIIAGANKPSQPNLSKIHEFFYHGKIYGEETFFKDIYEVRPGQYFHIRKDLKVVKKYNYWNLEDFDTNKQKNSYETIQSQFKDKLDLAVDSRMESDTAVGVMLSGGIDSNTILRLMLDQNKENIPLFFADNELDISSEYDRVEHYLDFYNDKFPNAELTLYKENVNSRNYIDLLKEFTWYHDEPVQFPISPQLMSLSSLSSKKNIKVLMSGEGADELLFGYDRFVRTKNFLSKNNDKNTNMKHLFFGGGVNNLNIINDLTRRSNYHDLETWKWLDKHYSDWSFDKLQMVYSQKYRLESLLQRQDRVGMSNGVEIRVPFLSPSMVNWCNELPTKYKISSGQTKKVLKDVMKNYLPNKMVYLKKQGSPSFISSWIDSKYSYEFISKLVSDNNGFCQAFLNGNKAKQIVQQHYLGNYQYSYIIWLMLVLEIWHSIFINNNTKNI